MIKVTQLLPYEDVSDALSELISENVFGESNRHEGHRILALINKHVRKLEAQIESKAFDAWYHRAGGKNFEAERAKFEGWFSKEEQES